MGLANSFPLHPFVHPFIPSLVTSFILRVICELGRVTSSLKVSVSHLWNGLGNRSVKGAMILSTGLVAKWVTPAALTKLEQSDSVKGQREWGSRASLVYRGQEEILR